jgi:alkanesulfonate monooxygenase
LYASAQERRLPAKGEMTGDELAIFSTCPQSRDSSADEYARRVAETARWSEQAGCEGMLVYTDNGILDPWLVSQVVIQSTRRLAPLVAVQAAYMHPYSAAKMVTSLAYLHGRKLYLNMVAGGFRNDLIALGDDTPHDERYERTIEYAQIITRLLAGETVTYEGDRYTVSKLTMTPPLAPELAPGLFISGSSPAGLDAAARIGAVAVKYPKRSGEEVQQAAGERAGMRVGIVTRPSSEQAWSVAHQRFPEDRKGQIAHNLAMKVSDSHWHRQLSDMAGAAAAEDDPYWLLPFENYATFCPYLVGSYERVAAELARYIQLGFHSFILDIPASEEELHHIGVVFEQARASVA